MTWRSQPRDSRGRWTKSTGGIVAVGVAVAVWAGGPGVGTGASGAAWGSTGTKVSAARVAQSKQAAVKGQPRLAWRKLGLRSLRKPRVKSATSCVINSYGQVRGFFLSHHCSSLKRTLFTLADQDDNTFVVSVSWVRMRQRGDVGPLKKLIDVDGTGSVTAIGAELLRVNGVTFTGTPFRSRPRGNRLTVAEGAVVNGRPEPEFFKTVVDVAAHIPG